MGGYLYALKDHNVSGLGRLTETDRNLFQTNIVTKRNIYLHEAGKFPLNDAEMAVLLSEIDRCLSIVTAL